MLGLLKKLFGGKTTEVAQPPVVEAPYKVEAPTVVSEKATEAVVASIEPKETKPKAPKKARAPKQGAPKKGGRKPKSKPQA